MQQWDSFIVSSCVLIIRERMSKTQHQFLCIFALVIYIVEVFTSLFLEDLDFV